MLAPLNSARPSARALELVDLVCRLQEIERVERTLAEIPRQLSQDSTHLPVGPQRAPSFMYARANQILSVCKWTPIVPYPRRLPYNFKWKASTFESDWENRFVFWTLNLWVRGDISLIRGCHNCRHWFYAVTNHQMYCTNDCRQQFHSRSYEFKEKRRLYMRRYRKDQEARDSHAKSLTQRAPNHR